MSRVFLLGGALIFLSACASSFPQTDRVLGDRPDIPRAAQVANVPFVDQEVGHCGPATLAMAMATAGREVPLAELTSQVYTPGKKGSLQQDMIGASRRHGMLAVPLEGLDNVLKEVAAGHPVIVFQNLGLSWFPKWHFALITGYDLKKESLVLNSGPDQAEVLSLRKFEDSWQRANHWALVVLKPQDLALTADELAHLKAASGIELVQRNDDARSAYLAILERWPKSLGALIGLGNLAYKDKDRVSAVRFLKQAVEYHPDSPIARHNLAVAESSL